MKANGFIVQNWRLRLARHPIEDALYIEKHDHIYAVADGVTRDPCIYLPDINGFFGTAMFTLLYPRPSPAKAAADIFVSVFPEVIRNYTRENRNEQAIRTAFEEANTQIKAWNEQHMPNSDYLMHDTAGCVAAGMIASNDTITYGYMTDAGIAVYDKNGTLEFKTRNEGPEQHQERIEKEQDLTGIAWTHPKKRKVFRKEYRNKEKEYGFGVLTGEESALSFVKTGAREIRAGEHALLYTDGCESVATSSACTPFIRDHDTKRIKKLCRQNIHSEGTLVHYIH